MHGGVRGVLALAQVAEESVELAQLLTGCHALVLQALVVLAQVGHLGHECHLVVLFLRQHICRVSDWPCLSFTARQMTHVSNIVVSHSIVWLYGHLT